MENRLDKKWTDEKEGEKVRKMESEEKTDLLTGGKRRVDRDGRTG